MLVSSRMGIRHYAQREVDVTMLCQSLTELDVCFGQDGTV